MHIHRAYTPPTAQTKRYEAFLGVDFSTDPSRVDPRRSPWAPNLISDEGGFPEKRPGYTTQHKLDGSIWGIYAIPDTDRETLLIHERNALIQLEPSGTQHMVIDSLFDWPGRGLWHRGKFWFFSGQSYFVAEENEEGIFTSKRVSEVATIPTTSISRDPDGGGTVLDPVNLLTPWRTNSFLGTETAVRYQLDAGGLDVAQLKATVNGQSLTEGVGFSVNRASGTVTFVTPPGKPAVMGADNVVITFSRTVAGYAARIEKSRCAALFGGGNGSYLFVGGSEERPNYDWRSTLEDPTYFPDTGYAVIGGDDSAVMGYLRLGEQLAVVKQPAEGDSTIFLRTAELDGEGRPVFPLRAGVVGVGAVSRRAILSLRDDPLFLSPAGIFALTARGATLERTVQSRSSRVDPRLAAEPDLDKACAVEWKNYLVVAVNGRCYVADARQRTPSGGDGAFEYEWYHWDNIPASCLGVIKGRLWFGTADGRVCVFRDEAGMNRYADDGAAIVASWSTKIDDDGDFMRLKMLPRKGAGVLIKPYPRSSVRVLVRTEADFGKEAAHAVMDIFSFADLDFTRLSFVTADTPQAVPISAGARRYQTIQIIVENDGVHEGFGVFGILRRFALGRHLR